MRALLCFPHAMLRPTARIFPSCSRALALLALVAAAGCAQGIDNRPIFGDLTDRVAFVGAELTIALEVTDPSGDPVKVRFETDAPNLCKDGRCRAGIVTDQGTQSFHWVPRPDDVGRHRFTFIASDGGASARKTITVEVRSSVGYNGLPKFLQPLGNGVTIDLGRTPCFDFDIVVDDPDSPAVTISQEAPLLEGAIITENDSFSATFEWCPTPDDTFGSGFRELHLQADDGVNPPTEKTFLLVVRYPAKPECPGELPNVTHTPADWDSDADIRITAHVDDDSGLKHAPIVYYATSDPGPDPDVSRMAQVPMTLTSGTRESGEWSAEIPNPVVKNPAAGTQNVYYVVSATDNDDALGPGDHTASFPAVGTSRAVVSLPSVAPAGPTPDPCSPCAADRQCGGAGHACVRMGNRGDAFCVPTCVQASDCPGGYVCPPEPVSSVDDARERVCVPDAGACVVDEVSTCADDTQEDNDTRALADTRPALKQGTTTSLVSCVSGGTKDEDWYRLQVTSTSQVEVSIDGNDASDLDLMLIGPDGKTLGVSETTRSDEVVTTCLGPGTYYARVYSFGSERNTYSLTWTARAASCNAPTACKADAYESDDGMSSARAVDWRKGYTVAGNSICGGSDDWYRVDLVAGDTVAVQAEFVHVTAADDLDFHFLDANGADLTPCSEADTSTCSAFQGQSLDSNEYYDFNAATSGTYYLVVHGFAGAENNYDIRFWKLD
ncbi:MAG: PPC domain-containing protein [Myxococcales bacterium]|nr:PPC domain-containing protein [Myxococcales bacterium]